MQFHNIILLSQMILIVLIIQLLVLIQNRIYDDTIIFTRFRRQGGWVYFHKMTLQKGLIDIKLSTKIRGNPYSNLQTIDFVIIKDSNWQQQLQNKCLNKNQMEIVHPLKTDSQNSISVYNFTLQQQSTVYFVFKDCKNKLTREYSNNNLYIDVSLSILSNNNHLGSDQDNFLIFPLVIIINFLLIKKIDQSRANKQQYQWAKLVIMIGIICQTCSFAWKGFATLLYYFYGVDYFIIDFFYLSLHALSQTLFICVFVLISYGWTINYLNNDDFDLYIPLMGMLGFLNVIVTLLNKINDTDHDKYHMYDTIPGYILIGLRIFIFIIYLIGLIISFAKTHRKKKFFFFAFLVFGVVYILSLPILVLITENFIHTNVQREFMFLGSSIFQLLSSLLITYQLISKKSSYRKVCYQNTSFIQDDKIF